MIKWVLGISDIHIKAWVALLNQSVGKNNKHFLVFLEIFRVYFTIGWIVRPITQQMYLLNIFVDFLTPLVSGVKKNVNCQKFKPWKTG